ncbi:MAG: CHASE3 domain-containing protein [Gemmatimonadota bacterium]|nr:CHASE3 domain-containing protein [Gemmatimonadota bacterium]
MRFSLPGGAQRRLLALVPVILVVLIGALTYERSRLVVADVVEVERSHEALEASESLLTRAIDAETGQRAYLLIGDETFLEPYRGARGDIGRALGDLRALVRDDPAQTTRVNAIERLVNDRFALLDSSILQRRAGRLNAAADSQSLLLGKDKMDRLRGVVAALQSHERSLLSERRTAERHGVATATAMIIVAAFLALLLSAFINMAIARALDDQDKANKELRRVNEDLERQSEQLEMQAVETESQAAELEATSEDLRSTNEALNRTTEAAELLSDASRVLSSTLDYEKTLEAVARLAVGDISDWCTVDLVDSEGEIRQVVVAHVDEERIKWARELGKRYPPDYSAATGVGQVIRTGRPEIYPEIPDEMLAAGAQDADHLAIMRELRFKSALIVPMIARGRTLGALTLVSSAKGRSYGDADLALATELATRAALAIDNAQLYRSALAASEAKSAFLATMSHELRTPLNAIIGYQSLLKEGIDGPLNESQLNQLTRIRSSADHLLALIDEVLTFSRVEAGKEVVNREDVSLRSIVDDALTMIKPLAQVKGLPVRAEGEDVRLYTDGGKVRQILLNLLSNALKFSDSGEIVVRSRPDGERASVSVMDTGIGIAAENLERIFDPFWQVEQRSTRKVGGTGLGLSVSRTLARLVGGDIQVESEVGKGSTFTLSLPIRQA